MCIRDSTIIVPTLNPDGFKAGVRENTCVPPVRAGVFEQPVLTRVPFRRPGHNIRHERAYRNKKDLNRAFPDRSDTGVQPSLPMTGTEEPEVKAIMRLAYSLPITAAASLHEGALVANYPWDGDKERRTGYSASPDDATFQHLARSYAQKHARMADQTPFSGDTPSGVRCPRVKQALREILCVVLSRRRKFACAANTSNHELLSRGSAGNRTRTPVIDIF